MFCSPVAKGASDVLLQGVNSELLVTVWLLAPHWNRTVSPTEALTAKGTYRRTPWVGATMTVCVTPFPLPLSEPTLVALGGGGV